MAAIKRFDLDGDGFRCSCCGCWFTWRWLSGGDRWLRICESCIRLLDKLALRKGSR